MRELPAVRSTQTITIGPNFFINPCPIATMVTWYTTTTKPFNKKIQIILKVKKIQPINEIVHKLMNYP